MNGFTKGIVAKAVVVALGASIMSGAIAGPAGAFSVSDSGCRGTTGLSPALGTVFYINLNGLGSAPNYRVTVNPLTVERSGCYAGDQVVTVTYRVWGYDSSRGWVLSSTMPLSLTLPPGWHGNFPLDYWRNAYRNVSIDATVVWRTSGGTFIGRRYINYNSVSDYSCPASLGQCVVYPDPTVGAYIHFN